MHTTSWWVGITLCGFFVVIGRLIGAAEERKKWRTQVADLEYLVLQDDEKAFIHALMDDPELIKMGDTHYYDGKYRRYWTISQDSIAVTDRNPVLCYKRWKAMRDASNGVKALHANS